LLRGIRMAAVPQFDHYGDTLVGTQLCVINRICFVRLSGAIENSNYFLHFPGELCSRDRKSAVTAASACATST
jgi:hypothetical protein